MLKIAERNVLLRAQGELPVGLKLATKEFRDGWDFIRSGSANQLERKIRTRGWHFIRIADEVQRSGVGESSQQAIACALKLALCRINEYFNAAEIRCIHLKAYPWFVLARVEVYPLRIQQMEVQAVPDDATPLPAFTRKKRLRPSIPWTSPSYGCALPLFKEMLVSSGSTHEGAQ